jgi:integrase
VKQVTKLKEPRGRTRFLDDDERARLLKACREHSNPALYTAVVLALSTGARQMEIWGLRWNQVSFERESITLYETKNDETRSLPLKGHALETLRNWHDQRPDGTDLVFPSRRDPTRPLDLRPVFEQALEKANIKDFRWHDLRHTAASYLAMNGASPAVIAEVLGHKTLEMVKRYAHLSESHVSKEVESMNNRLFGNQS